MHDCCSRQNAKHCQEHRYLRSDKETLLVLDDTCGRVPCFFGVSLLFKGPMHNLLTESLQGRSLDNHVLSIF